MPHVTWEKIETLGNGPALYRAAAPNGWLLATEDGRSLTFVPDSNHDWKDDVAKGIFHKREG